MDCNMEGAMTPPEIARIRATQREERRAAWLIVIIVAVCALMTGLLEDRDDSAGCDGAGEVR